MEHMMHRSGAGRSATAQANRFLTLYNFHFCQAGLFQQLDEFLYLSDIHSFRSCLDDCPAFVC
jgi:hypothetical protein